MKNFTTTTKSTKNNNSLQPLSLNDLTTIFGGNDDVVNPDDLLGDGGVIEDLLDL